MMDLATVSVVVVALLAIGSVAVAALLATVAIVGHALSSRCSGPTEHIHRHFPMPDDDCPGCPACTFGGPNAVNGATPGPNPHNGKDDEYLD